ncbi:MAG TPA: Zn-dependent alcohol dehydrogenase [Vicinamibacteria bacterium]
MKAAVCHQRNQPLRVEEVALDPPGPGEVAVRLAASGVCHSDLSAISGVLPVELPAVLGHEGAGTVEAVGPGVSGLAPGDPVVLSWVTSCGSCFFCGCGRPNLCEVGERINRTHRQPDGTARVRLDGRELQAVSALGTLAERAVVPAAAAVKLPAGVPLDAAALLGCSVMTGVGAVLNTARVAPGSSVAVFGAGGVGLNVVQGAVLAGAARVIVVDTNPRKLSLAESFGATDAVDASQGDPATAVRKLTAGRGADYAFEAVGRKTTIEQAYAATRRGGTCVVVGIGAREESAAINTFFLPILEKRLVGCWYGSADVHRDFPRLLAFWQAGRLKLDALITQRYRLEEVNEALAALAEGRNARGLVVFS